MESKVKDIIIKALEDTGYEVEIDNGTLIADDYVFFASPFCIKLQNKNVGCCKTVL